MASPSTDLLWKDITAALAVINDAADMLADFELDEAEQAEAVDTIKASAQKVRDILHEYVNSGKETG